MKVRSFIFYVAVSVLLAFALHRILDISVIVAWFGSINAVLFILMGKDKGFAKMKMKRTPETTLFGLALIGGFPGMFAARRIFNHKTTKTSFVITMWLLFILQLSASAWYFGHLDLEQFGLHKKETPQQELESSTS
ncbi:MAG: DUF1294 domain-containing protein [Alphaproteobacteria bacterium]|nr:DUF1294 domain-containing protein [Alphaproteobacteria bacterium]